METKTLILVKEMRAAVENHQCEIVQKYGADDETQTRGRGLDSLGIH